MFGEAAAGASAETGRGRRDAETGKRSLRLKQSAGDARSTSTQIQAGSLHWRIRLVLRLDLERASRCRLFVRGIES